MSRPSPLATLAGLPPARQVDAVLRRLAGDGGGPLAGWPAGREAEAPDPGRVDGHLLEAAVERALGGARGAVFTPAPEARLLAAAGLALAAERRGGPPAGEAARHLLAGRRHPALGRALDGLRVLDPACGGGALLAGAARLAAAQGATLSLLGLDLAPLAARAAAARLALLGAAGRVRRADALAAPWPAADLVLGNPPFLRHERLPPAQKARAARRSGLSRQADLSAHLAAVALRHAPVVALVLPRALFTARSAAPLLAEAGARGGFRLRLRSRAAGSFAASVDTLLVAWCDGGEDTPPAEVDRPLDALVPADLARLLAPPSARPAPPPRPGAPARRGPGPTAVPLGDWCDVRFGMKTGCNAFFHLAPLGGGRYRSALLGEVALGPADVLPLLASLKEARAPVLLAPRLVLFRPSRPSPAALAYVAAGEAAGVHRRPTCAARGPWWRVAPGRGPAPLLYPAKVGARAFAVVNEAGLCEDKKWLALWPRGVEPWLAAAVLSSSPVRLAVDEGARQLTGAQAIADVDCRVLAAAPVPPPAALRREEAALREAWGALARAEVTTDLPAMLARPAQRALDEAVGRALGLAPREVAARRAALAARVADRLAHAGAVRARLAAGAGAYPSQRSESRPPTPVQAAESTE